jgi:hypothetical protein
MKSLNETENLVTQSEVVTPLLPVEPVKEISKTEEDEDTTEEDAEIIEATKKNN